MRVRLAAEQEPTLHASLANIAEVVVFLEGLEREIRRTSVSLLGSRKWRLVVSGATFIIAAIVAVARRRLMPEYCWS